MNPTAHHGTWGELLNPCHHQRIILKGEPQDPQAKRCCQGDNSTGRKSCSSFSLHHAPCNGAPRGTTHTMLWGTAAHGSKIHLKWPDAAAWSLWPPMTKNFCDSPASNPSPGGRSRTAQSSFTLRVSTEQS